MRKVNTQRRPKLRSKLLIFIVVGLGLLVLAGGWWGTQALATSAEQHESGVAERATQPTPVTTRSEPTTAQHPGTARGQDTNALQQTFLREVRKAAAQAASEPENVITPEQASDPNEDELRAGFAELARARKEGSRKPDLELAEGLLSALKEEAAPMERFALVNAYLDAVAGIEDPAQAQAAVARLGEVGAGPDAVYK